ncbi:hypothetical protein ABZ848_03580 [Streptomyces sp. NPDC047081]|uniref:hypothetical protein n=1 Tax=Streptomyces sp. NPDC047081 TaxID=3154706 RepID=UPI0033EBE38D
MDGTDGHIHVDARMLLDNAAVRGMLARTFDLVGDSPTVVTSGCGLEVPYAMTSRRPESVTCLPCREHAAREHLRQAEQLDRLGGAPGVHVPEDQVRQAAARLRSLARRFMAG